MTIDSTLLAALIGFAATIAAATVAFAVQKRRERRDVDAAWTATQLLDLITRPGSETGLSKRAIEEIRYKRDLLLYRWAQRETPRQVLLVRVGMFSAFFFLVMAAVLLFAGGKRDDPLFVLALVAYLVCNIPAMWVLLRFSIHVTKQMWKGKPPFAGLPPGGLPPDRVDPPTPPGG